MTKKFLVEFTSSMIVEAEDEQEASEKADEQLPVQALVQRVSEYDGEEML